MAFYRRDIVVSPHFRLYSKNVECDDGGAVTTVTFEDKDGETLVVLHDLYPSKEALDEAIASGSTSGFDEQFGQLDELVVTLGGRAG
jgi:hypothetical protein